MRIRLSLALDITRTPKPTDDPGGHRDLDTLVERAGEPRVGFTVPTSAEPYDPDERAR